MDIQKKVMKYSALLTGFMLIISILLEWNIMMNLEVPDCFKGHKSFILNYVVGITASGILTFVIAGVSYLTEKKRIIVSYSQTYYELLKNMKVMEMFFFKHSNENQISIQQAERTDLYYYLEKINSTLNVLINLGLVFDPIFPLFKKNYKVKEKNNFYSAKKKFHSFCVNFSMNIDGFFDYDVSLKNFMEYGDTKEDEKQYLSSYQMNFLKNIYNMTIKSDDYGVTIKKFGEQLEKRVPID